MLLSVTLVVRLLLGLFAASLGGGAVYLLGILITLAFGIPGPLAFKTSALLSTAVGGGIGAFLGWMTWGGEWRENLVTFGLTLGGATAGAAIGLQVGFKAETSYKAIVSITGIPQLSGIIIGAIVGANVPPLLHVFYRRLRGARFSA